MPKTRLDLLLVQQGLAESRTKAQALIMAGLVYRGEVKLDKAGLELPEDTELTVRGKEHPWVSRGGVKLAHALAEFKLDVQGAIAMDVGASTGGFTDVLLTHGAAKVYAVDVGHGQLDQKLRSDPRVVVMENTNARFLTQELLVKAEQSLNDSPPACGGSWRGEHAPLAQTPDSTRIRTTMNRADDLRKTPTEAEKKLWQHLRASRLNETKFRRQQAIGAFIVDFVAMEQKLIIEIDGGQHTQNIGYDAARTRFLEEAGYQVVRYWNHEVMQNMEGVLEDIHRRLSKPGALPPPNLPPHAGGGIRTFSLDFNGMEKAQVASLVSLPPHAGGAGGGSAAGLFNLIVCDASFISLKKVLPAALALAKQGATLVTLIKPQFEVGKAEVSRGKGVIRDPVLHQAVCDDIKAWIAEQGWQVRGLTTSPITGPKGNVEFLLYAVKAQHMSS